MRNFDLKKYSHIQCNSPFDICNSQCISFRGSCATIRPSISLATPQSAENFPADFSSFFLCDEKMKESDLVEGGRGGGESYPAWLREGLQQTRERTDTSWKILEGCLASGDVALNLVLSSFPNRFSVHLDTASF